MNQLEFRLASPNDAQAVEAFNHRMAAAGQRHGLSLEQPFRTIELQAGSPITLERLFCFDGREVRGGVQIKRMTFLVNGRDEEVACPVYPVSEGVINPEFALVGVRIQKEIMRRYPLVYALGGGNINTPFARAMRHEKYLVFPVPFHFTVFRAYSFLRNLEHLRRNAMRRLVLDLAAMSGVGAVGFGLLKLVQRLRNRSPHLKNVVVERATAWGDWADELWEKGKGSYSFVGDRSMVALQSLYPDGHAHLIKLRFSTIDTKQTIGWSVITASRVSEHKQFGNMVLGAMVDMFALPEHAFQIVSGSLVALRQARADIVVVNHSDHRWNRAFKKAGMLAAPMTNYYLFLAPRLGERLAPIDDRCGQFFVTRGDGHGPVHLW